MNINNVNIPLFQNDTAEFEIAENLTSKIIEDFYVELEMGKPLFGSKDIPLSKTIDPGNISLKIRNNIIGLFPTT